MLLPQDIHHKGRGVSGLLLLPQVVFREQPPAWRDLLGVNTLGKGCWEQKCFTLPLGNAAVCLWPGSRCDPQLDQMWSWIMFPGDGAGLPRMQLN